PQTTFISLFQIERSDLFFRIGERHCQNHLFSVGPTGESSGPPLARVVHSHWPTHLSHVSPVETELSLAVEGQRTVDGSVRAVVFNRAGAVGELDANVQSAPNSR